ncbi:MAG: PAS domain S-box protein [Chthoniobacterales bacterium]
MKERLDARYGILCFAVLVILINDFEISARGRYEEQHAVRSAVAHNVRLATALQEYTARTLAHAAASARFVAREYARNGAAIDLAEIRAQRALDPELFVAATIMDEDGRIVASTLPQPDVGEMDAIRTEAFAVHAPQRATTLLVGKPVRPSADAPSTVPLTMRLDKTDGDFGGIVILEVNSARFTDFDSASSPRTHDVVALIGLDSIVRSRRTGQVSSAGQSLAGSPLFGLATRESADLVGDSPVDGVRRLFSFRRVPGYPLIVAAGVSEADALADFRERMHKNYVRSGVLTIIIAVLATFVIAAMTRTRRAFAQLRAREEEFRTVTESMPQLVWITEPDGRHTYFNQKWVDYTGLSVEQSIAGWEAAFDPAEQQGALSRWREAVATGAIYESQYRLRRADGVYRWMLARALPLRDAEGTITKWFGTSTDIDTQVLAQAKLREQADLLDLTRDAMIVRQADDTIDFWNRGAERMYGWTAEEVLGVHAQDFAYADSAKVLAAKKHLAEFGEWSGEVEHLRKDGSTITVSSRWTAVPNEHKTEASVLVVNTDLTEQKKLEQQVLRAQRLDSISTLAHGVAHDLNTALAPVLMAAPLLREENLSAGGEKLVSMIEGCAERGAAIVQQVRTFARGADGARVLVRPAYLLAEIANLIGEGFPKTISVQTSYAQDLWPVEADSAQLHQLLLNLCTNACEAMPGGGRLSLSAENFHVDENYAAMTLCAKAGPYILICVSDTGCGIPRHLIDKIYDPFFTTKPAGKGSGLGLSTALGIAKSHGGVLDGYSSPGSTTMRVLLPAMPAAGPKNGAGKVDLPRGRGETILVVENEEKLREVAEAVLLKSGYKVLIADSGPAALGVFAQRSAEVALVLTHYAMPLMDGITLARTLFKMKPETPVVISSGAEELPGTPAEEVNIRATLRKPYSQSALLRILDQILHLPDKLQTP